MLKSECNDLYINAELIKNVGLSCAAYMSFILAETSESDTTLIKGSKSKVASITMRKFRDVLGISYSMQAKHRAKLEKLGVLKVVRKGIPARLFFIIDESCIVELNKILPLV